MASQIQVVQLDRRAEQLLRRIAEALEASNRRGAIQNFSATLVSGGEEEGLEESAIRELATQDGRLLAEAKQGLWHNLELFYQNTEEDVATFRRPGGTQAVYEMSHHEWTAMGKPEKMHVQVSTGFILD